MELILPFLSKKKIISYIDELTLEAESTQSVNTIYLKNDKLIGHNTDIDGFKMSVKIKILEKLKLNLFYIIN